MSPHASVLLSTLVLAAAVCGQERTTTTTKLGSGTVTIDYAPTELKGRSPEKDLPPGAVFRMSSNEAAQLSCDVPLLFGSTVVPPGKHRLSARHDGKGKWEVLAFHGVPFHDPAVHSVVLPVKFAEEKKELEQLTLAASATSGSPDLGTIALHWGKFSLTLAPRALTVTKVEGTLGGKPATFEFYGVPSTRDTHRAIARAEMLRVGTATQTGEGGVTYAIFGKRVSTGTNDVNLIFVNETLQNGPGVITANSNTITMLKGLLPQLPAERAAGIEAFMEGLAKSNAATELLIAAAKKMPATVEIEGDVETGQKAASSLMVATKKTDDGLAVTLQLGQGAASFKVTDGAFHK